MLVHDGWIYAIVVTDEGKVYTGGNDGSVRFLPNPLRDTKPQVLNETKGEILSLCCDENRLYTGDDKGVVVCFENDNFQCRIETSESCCGLVVEGDLIYTIRDRDCSVNWITSRKLVANIVSQANIPGRNPLAVFGPLQGGHRQFIAIVDRSGKGFSVHQNRQGKQFALVADAADSHEMIINAICGLKTTIFTGDYAGRLLLKWK